FLSCTPTSKPPTCSPTTLSQSGIGHLRKLPQRTEKLGPLLPQRQQLLFPRCGQPVTPPPPAISADFPRTTHHPLVLHAVEKRIERRQGKAQLAASLPLDPVCDFVAVQGAALQHAENRQLRCSPLCACADHMQESYM